MKDHIVYDVTHFIPTFFDLIHVNMNYMMFVSTQGNRENVNCVENLLLFDIIKFKNFA